MRVGSGVGVGASVLAGAGVAGAVARHTVPSRNATESTAQRTWSGAGYADVYGARFSIVTPPLNVPSKLT